MEVDKTIDYAKLLTNVNSMINLCEYDGMRSSGKIKINAETLVHLYTLKGIYEDKLKKNTLKKEGK